MTDASGRSAAVLTFLIADIRGYTRFTRERGDAAAASLAKRFAGLARDAVEARGGRVIELRGDEALAVFESPAQAVRAAVEFQATCAEESEADPAFPLPVGIGIDSGEAVPVEDGYRGVALNMAARLCSNAAAGQVLVTRTVVASAVVAEGEIRFVGRGPATFKGFERAVDVIEAVAGAVLELSSAPDAAVPEADRGIPPELDPLTPIVGREHEMRWLRGTWRQVRRGRGCVLFVSGPAQIGKTRLAGEIASYVHAGGGLIRYAGPGGVAAAMALSAIQAARAAATPTLLVLDDVDLGGPAVAHELLGSFDDFSRHPVLVVALLRDPAAAVDLAAVIERADKRGDGHRVLAPLDLDGVRGIVRLYVGEDEAEVPVESMARASQGVPGRVHEVVSEWAGSEASRRLSAAAEFLAAGRDRHASNLAFANNVIALKLGRLYSVGGRDVPPIETCPYKGLAAFDGDDAAYFFGRERLVGELAARTVQAGLLAVVGASGSGKSSVIAAGLLPSLAAGLLPGSERWAQVSMRPGEHPLQELRAALSSEEDDPLAAAVRNVPSGARLVLAVDQFEETFTMCAGEEERGAFVDMLTGAAGRCPERVAVILSIRGDYYAHCAPYPQLAGALGANHVLVGPLTPEELRRAIELPARRSGLRVESALTDALVEEVAGEPGGLPLLSTALVELWQAREGGWIRLDAYQRTGGVRGAVSRLAESSYQQLPDQEQAAARRVFLRLVAAGEGEAVTRRRVPLEEFDLGRDATAAGVLARLTQDRLLTMGEGTVEVAHEALLREWPRLQAWLAEDAQGRQLRHHLTQVSRQWQAGGNEPSELYRGARLSAALDWSAGHALDLNELESAFLVASRQASERDAERQRRANRRLRGLLSGVAALLVLALVAGALALVQRASARRSARDAQRAATVALAQSLGAQAVSEPRIDLAMLLARAAVALHPSLRTRSDLLATLLRVPTALRTLHWTANRNAAVAVSPNGRTIAIEDNNGNTVVENAATGRQIGTLQADILAFGPDGSLLTVAGGILVLDPATLNVTNTIPFPAWASGNDYTAGGVAFGDGGARMAVVVVRQIPAPTGPTVTTLARIVQYGYPGGRVAAPVIAVPSDSAGVAYAAGGRRLVVVAPGATIVFDARTGRRIRSYPVGGVSAAVSPDGNTVGIGGADGSVRFLDLATGKVTLGTGAQAGGAVVEGFTPDGKTLITSGNDSKTLLWDVAAHTIRQTLAGHAGPIHAQAISADGATLYTGSFDANVLAWDLTGRRGLFPSFIAAQTDPSLQTFSLAISPDSKTVAVGSTSGVVNLWDMQTLQKIQSFQAIPGEVTALSFGSGGRSLLVAADTPQPHRAWLRIWTLGPHPRLLRSMRGPQHITWAAWSPDSKTVAAVGWQLNQNPQRAGVVTEWDASTGRPLGPPVVVHGGAPVDVSFAPHGDTVAVTGINGVTEVLDPARRTVQSRFTVPGGTVSFGVTFSPDGSTLATSDWSGSVDLWNPKTGNPLGQIPDPSQTPTASVAWSPDGQTIAVTDGDQTLRLFDVATRQELGPPFPLRTQQGTSAYATYAAFTPDGANVVVTTDTGQTWIFPATLKAWEAHACAVANRNLTPAEWQQFLPGTPYRQLCPATPGT